MQVIDLEYFEVLVPNGDGLREHSVANFSTEYEANVFGVQQYKNWSFRVVHVKKSVIILDFASEYQKQKEKENRQKALAKLTQEEKILLGLM